MLGISGLLMGHGVEAGGDTSIMVKNWYEDKTSFGNLCGEWCLLKEREEGKGKSLLDSLLDKIPSSIHCNIPNLKHSPMQIPPWLFFLYIPILRRFKVVEYI